jgi:hypothetical protein
LEKNESRKLQECILNIDMTCRCLYAANIERIKFKIPKGSVIFMDSIRYSYIQLCTIQDELKILNRIAKNDEYLKNTLYIISPASRALNKYTGIRKARNVMFAHFNRDRNNNFTPWWKELIGLKLPRFKDELVQIMTYLQLINGIIVTRHYEQLKEISLEAEKEVNEYFDWIKNQEKQVIENLTPFDNVDKEVEKRMIEQKMTEIIIDSFAVELIELIKSKTE